MTLDLTVLSLILFFAFLGAITGAAKQLAHWAALFVAGFCARPLGALLAPKLEKAFQGPKLLFSVGATVLVFIVTMLVVRYALTQLLRRVLAGHAQERVSVDRALGFVLGGAKVAAMALVFLSALVFLQSNVTVSGKRLRFASEDSYSMQLAKKYNVFEMTQFSAVKDLGRVSRAMQDPARAPKLLNDPAFRALYKDPKFRQLTHQPDLKRALQTGDTAALLRNNDVFDVIQDPTLAARLHAAAEATEEK